MEVKQALGFGFLQSQGVGHFFTLDIGIRVGPQCYDLSLGQATTRLDRSLGQVDVFSYTL